MRISDWSSDVCSSDLQEEDAELREIVLADELAAGVLLADGAEGGRRGEQADDAVLLDDAPEGAGVGRDRKSVVEGKSVSVRVDLGGGRIIKKKTTNADDGT